MDLVVKGCERRSCGFCRGIGSGNFLRARSFFSCRALGCCGSQRFACGMFGTPGTSSIWRLAAPTGTRSCCRLSVAEAYSS